MQKREKNIKMKRKEEEEVERETLKQQIRFVHFLDSCNSKSFVKIRTEQVEGFMLFLQKEKQQFLVFCEKNTVCLTEYFFLHFFFETLFPPFLIPHLFKNTSQISKVQKEQRTFVLAPRKVSSIQNSECKVALVAKVALYSFLHCH